MIEWPLIFLGGLLGSSHCVGMCGAFALSIGIGSKSVASNAGRQLWYTLGRIFTYSFAGAVAGFAGAKLTRLPVQAINLQVVLAVAAGILLIGQGLHSAGVMPRFRHTTPAARFCPGQSLFSSFLIARGWHNSFLAGVLTGFLPCGLVYAYLALAAGSGNIFQGAAIMALLGAGTAPLMILTGTGGSLLTIAARRHLLRAAAWCVVLTGALTLCRGVGWAIPPADAPANSCPLCRTSPGLPSPGK